MYAYLCVCTYIFVHTYKRCFLCVDVKGIGKTNFTPFSLSSQKKDCAPVHKSTGKNTDVCPAANVEPNKHWKQ